MRHGKKYNHLSRPAAHRKALLMNLAKALILHKRINTTVAKAKALRKFIEPLLTNAKKATTHARRVVFAQFQDKEPVKELYNNIASKIAARPGGYTRIIRLGNRLGDNAEMCLIELVDYNELLNKDAKPVKVKTRRSRRGGGKAHNQPEQVPTAAEDNKQLAAPEDTSEPSTPTATEGSSEALPTTEPSVTKESTSS